MFVSDLTHFLELPEDAPGPAVNMAEHLTWVVRAATGGPAGVSWVTALQCRRRPQRRRCPGRMVVFRADLPAPIGWHCDSCGDEGVISGWQGSYADLRGPHRAGARKGRSHVAVSDEVMAALRDLRLVDTGCERLIFAARAEPNREGAVLDIDADDLEELLGFVAAEANHEDNRRRQQRLDAALAALSDAARTFDL